MKKKKRRGSMGEGKRLQRLQHPSLAHISWQLESCSRVSLSLTRSSTLPAPLFCPSFSFTLRLISSLSLALLSQSTLSCRCS